MGPPEDRPPMGFNQLGRPQQPQQQLRPLMQQPAPMARFAGQYPNQAGGQPGGPMYGYGNGGMVQQRMQSMPSDMERFRFVQQPGTPQNMAQNMPQNMQPQNMQPQNMPPQNMQHQPQGANVLSPRQFQQMAGAPRPQFPQQFVMPGQNMMSHRYPQRPTGHIQSLPPTQLRPQMTSQSSDPEGESPRAYQHMPPMGFQQEVSPRSQPSPAMQGNVRPPITPSANPQFNPSQPDMRAVTPRSMVDRSSMQMPQRRPSYAPQPEQMFDGRNMSPNMAPPQLDGLKYKPQLMHLPLANAMRAEGAFGHQEFAFTECLLRGLAAGDRLPKIGDQLVEVLKGLTGSEPQLGLWKSECYRAQTDPQLQAATNGRLLQSNSAYTGEIWLKSYSEPKSLRDFCCLRIYSAEHLVVPSSFPCNARRVSEASVSPQFCKLLPALGFRRRHTNDVFVAAYLFHHNPGTPDAHLLILIQKFFKDEKMVEDLFPGQYVVEVIGRVESDNLLTPLSRRIQEFCKQLQPFVQFSKF